MGDVTVRPHPTPTGSEGGRRRGSRRRGVWSADDVRASVIGRPEIIDERRTVGRFLLVLGAVIAAFGLALWGLTDTIVGAEQVELPRLPVPSVESLSLEEATARLEDAGFTVRVMYQPNEAVPKGEVIGQRPLAGYKADQGDLITVLASDGPLGFTVPDLVGMRVEDALVTIAGAAVQVEVVETFDEEIRAGEIVAMLPPEGARLGTNGLLRLSVSVGPAPRVVPDVVNQPIENVLVALGRAGLMVGAITEQEHPNLAEGTVVALGTPPGTEVPRDTPIDLVVSVSREMRRVPYLTGLWLSSAQEVLRSVGLSAQVVTVDVPPGDPSIGRVTGQGTAPQTRVPKGSNVTITVAVAPS